MTLFILLLLVPPILLLLLWLARTPKSPGYGTRIVDPDFKPVPRPTDTFVDPPRKKVDIQVQRNQQGVPVDLVIMQGDLRLGAGEQVAWSGGPSLGDMGAKIGIRFSPNATPFVGASFKMARGGTALSGTATRAAATNAPRKYTILATTPDGFLLTKTASVTPAPNPAGQGEEKYQTSLAQMAGPVPESGYGERYEDPDFTPIDRPAEIEFLPSIEVRINVVRREGDEIDIIVDPEEVVINPNQQVAWTPGPSEGDSGGKPEIRFAPNATPFNGDTFITARGGTIFSGLPVGGSGAFTYKILLTTPDGIFRLREKDAQVTVTG